MVEAPAVPSVPKPGGGKLDFGKKVGPLPLGIWVLAVGAGLFVSYYLNSRDGGGSEDKGESTGDGIENPDVGRVGGVFLPVDPPTDTDTEPAITDNDEWARAAASYLLGLNTDPALVDAAIRNYLTGNKLTANEQSVINAALKKFGIPPDALPPVAAPKPGIPFPEKPQPKTPPRPQPKPKPKPKTPPKRPTRIHVVKRGESLWKIAQRYYHNGAKWTKIYNANRDKIKNPSLIYAGQRLVIPY